MSGELIVCLIYQQSDIETDCCRVSLHADVLDTPDFFWDREELEPIYARTCKYLDMEQRVSVLNSRLDLLKVSTITQKNSA